MVSLLDVAPLSIKVSQPGNPKQPIDVVGVSAEGIVLLLQRFPELRLLLTGTSVTPDKLIKMAPEALAAVLACATGTPGNKKAEAIAAKLPLETQIDILDAAVQLTMPGGIGPFVARLTQMAEAVGVVAESVPMPSAPPSASSQKAEGVGTAASLDMSLPLPSNT